MRCPRRLGRTRLPTAADRNSPSPHMRALDQSANRGEHCDAPSGFEPPARTAHALDCAGSRRYADALATAAVRMRWRRAQGLTDCAPLRPMSRPIARKPAARVLSIATFACRRRHGRRIQQAFLLVIARREIAHDCRVPSSHLGPVWRCMRVCMAYCETHPAEFAVSWLRGA